ncbi:MAG: hypothetical protein ACRDO8_09845, partial [Nocardioidaceae bacterium]
MGDPNDLLLPAGTRLIHIGPHKTGTSALQGAIHQARGELASHGVHVAGEPPRPSRAVWAVTGGTGPIGAPRAAMKHWNRLVAEIDAAGDQRVVVSNETFSLARADAISRIVGDLGPERVHVVGMLRRLDKILPSQWQQMIADGGHRVSYDGWLSSVFGARRPEGFWRRHGYGDVTRRWAEGVGVENVTMVVVDETDREVNLRLFERFLGLPDGILQLVETRENRSLTFGEVEMLRAFNAEFRDLGWVNEAQPQYVRRGAIPSLKQRKPEPDEARIVTPQWALDRATEAAQEGIDAVRSLGVRVVGDLSALVRPPEPPATAVPDPATTMVEPATAALAVSGVIEIATTQAPLPHLYKTPDTDSGKVDPGKVDPGKVDPGLREVEAMTTHELVDVLRARVRLRPRPGRARPTVPGQTSPGQTSPGSPGSHTVPDPAPLLPRGALLVHVDPDDPRGPGSDASRKAA